MNYNTTRKCYISIHISSINFKDKYGNIFVPTSKTTIEKMKQSKDYQEVKENIQNKPSSKKENENKKEE